MKAGVSEFMEEIPVLWATGKLIIHQHMGSLGEETLFIFVSWALNMYLSHIRQSTHFERNCLNYKESSLGHSSEPNYFYFINICNMFDSTSEDK